MKKEKLMRALNDVGDDLLHMAEHRKFPNPWRKWISMVACILLVVSLTTLALPYFPMGCGAGSEAPETEAPAMEEAAAEENTAENTTKETAHEEAPIEEPAAEQEMAGTRDETGTDIVAYGGTYYYLNYDIVLPGQTPGNLGDEIGIVNQANRRELPGCKVYAVAYATWYDNHTFNGISVPDQIYVETTDGFVYGRTYNEKIVSRYTAADVQAALDRGDENWILQTFVVPLETYGVTTILDGKANEEQMNRLFLASLNLNTGVAITDKWQTEQGYVVPAEDLRWRLVRFLEDVPDTGDVFLPYEDYEPMDVNPTVKSAVMEDNTLHLRIDLADGSEKYYEIRFDEDSWRYINVLTPDGEP